MARQKEIGCEHLRNVPQSESIFRNTSRNTLDSLFLFIQHSHIVAGFDPSIAGRRCFCDVRESAFHLDLFTVSRQKRLLFGGMSGYRGSAAHAAICAR